MKNAKHVALIALALLVSALLNPRGSAATVAHWRFEEGTSGLAASTAEDSSGNNLTGTVHGEVVWSSDVAASQIPTTGAPNVLSVRFDGNSRIFIPDSPALALTGSLTVEAFIKANSPGGGCCGAAQIFFRGDDRGGYDPYCLMLTDKTNLYFAVSSAEDQTVAVEAPITLHEWHHVAGTLDDATGNIRLYIDGIQVADRGTGIRPFGPLTGPEPGCGIGNVQSDKYDEHFDGLIDEIRISDVALWPDQFLILQQSIITWTTPASDTPRYWSCIASSADGRKLVAVEQLAEGKPSGRIYTSDDFGITWTERQPRADWRAVASSADGDKLVAVPSDGHIFTSSDAGLTWTPRGESRGWIWGCVASSADGSKLVALSNQTQIWTSADSGLTWTSSSGTGQNVVSSADGNTLIVFYYEHRFISTDSGATWTYNQSVLPDWQEPKIASSADGNKLVGVGRRSTAVGFEDVIYTSTDSGMTWTQRMSICCDGWKSAVASSADGSRLVVIRSAEGQVLTSTDYGVTWSANSRNIGGAWWSVASSADGCRLAAARGGHFFYPFIGTCGEPQVGPFITSQPQSDTVSVGATITCSVTASGTLPLAYQWRKDGVSLAHETNAVLTIPSAQPWHVGSYSVVVANSAGSVISSNADLIIVGVESGLWRGLIGYYTFNGDPSDVSGWSNHGVETGAGLNYEVDRFGLAGAGLQASGQGGSISVPTLVSVGPSTATPLSLSFWAKRGALGAIVTKYQNGSAAESDFAVWLYGGVLNVAGNGSDYLSFAPTGTGDWTHFCIALAPGENGVKVWSDGAFLGQGTASFNQTVSGTPMRIGRFSGVPDSPLLGMVDDLRLYNWALTTEDAATLYAADSQVPIPALLTQPEDVAVDLGGQAQFSVAVYSLLSASYQWHGPSGAVAEATTATLVLPTATVADEGAYWVVVENAYGAATSRLASLTLRIPPSVAQEPVGSLVLKGASVSLAVTASGTEPLQYQWYKDNAEVPGATGATLRFDSAQVSDAGTYVVVVSNAFGTVTSTPAILEVVEPPDYRLNILSSGGGFVITDPFLQDYPSNATVQCTAQAAGGWTFLDWLGDASGTSPELTLTMNSEKCIQARFGTSLSVANPVHGTIEVVPLGPLYPSGTVVQLRARPEAGHYFANWTGALGGSASPVPYTVQTAFQTVGAEFLPLPEGKVALVLVSEGEGQVVADPRVNVCAEGTAVTLTARPKPDQEFLGWSGDASGNTSPLTLAMDKSKVVVASFSKRPRLDAWTCPTPLHDGAALLLLTGEWGATYEVQVSSDLLEWGHLTTLTNTLGRSQFLDPSAALGTARFYRAMAQP